MINLRIGDLLVPSFYMEANGKKISGVIIDLNDKRQQCHVFLNNGVTRWLDYQIIIDLFQVAK